MNKNQILHITNDFSGSTVYKNLVKALDDKGVTQKVYTAVRNYALVDKNRIELQASSSEIIYSNILNTYTRINYKTKINKIVVDIQKKVSFEKICIIHAHTWHSDGGVAYELYKKFEIPYIITVRNTDLNLFFKYMLHLRGYGMKILQNASKIIFISPVYLNRLFSNRAFFSSLNELKRKSIVIPNGVSSFWINNSKRRKEKINEPYQLLYIGKFTKGKNVLRLLRSVQLLNNKNVKCHLNLVGIGGKEFNKAMNFIKNKELYTYHGKIIDNIVLEKLFTQCDIFTMPSRHETFGLVYIEALSQGIPILYTKGEGIDGYYSSSIGEAVDSKNVNEIALGIEKIGKNYHNYSFVPAIIAKNHDWNEIAKKYKVIYSEIVGNRISISHIDI